MSSWIICWELCCCFWICSESCCIWLSHSRAPSGACNPPRAPSAFIAPPSLLDWIHFMYPLYVSFMYPLQRASTPAELALRRRWPKCCCSELNYHPLPACRPPVPSRLLRLFVTVQYSSMSLASVFSTGTFSSPLLFAKECVPDSTDQALVFFSPVSRRGF